MKKYTSQEIKEFVSKPLFDEKVILNKDPSWPKISIVTPSYNQAKFLERTILSVLNQNYPNLEYIIIDGGSTDGSVEIIKKYEKYLAYWVSEKDKGQVDAINKGFRMATGELVAWQNSDDMYLPEAFEIISKIYEANPNYDVFYGHIMFLDANDNILDILKVLPFSFFCNLYEGIQVHNQATFFKKIVFSIAGFLNSGYKFAFDYEFMCRLGYHKFRFYRINKFIGSFRLHSFSKTSTIPYIGLEEHNNIRQIYISNSVIKIPPKLGYIFCRMRRFVNHLKSVNGDYLKEKIKKKFFKS